jgi:hypothetical protein
MHPVDDPGAVGVPHIVVRVTDQKYPLDGAHGAPSLASV